MWNTLEALHRVEEGSLLGGLPYLAVGSGPPLLYLRGFTGTHTNPTGLHRYLEVKVAMALGSRARVYLVCRAPHLPPQTTMADIADQHAAAIQDEFGAPVDVVGVSSGGSVALQLAADHPHTVRRLVVVASGCRLDPHAGKAQLSYVNAVAAGRRGAHHLAPYKVSSRAGVLLAGGLMWLLDPLLRPADPSDMLAFARAEDAFDLTDRLSEISAPTLVVAGEQDTFYPMPIARATAFGVQRGTLVAYPRTSHAGTLASRRVWADVNAYLSEGLAGSSATR